MIASISDLVRRTEARRDADEPGPDTSTGDWQQGSEFGGIYRVAARQSLATRNPVIVIPGIMGSRLMVKSQRRSIWGDFTSDHANPTTAEDAPLIALPMSPGEPLDRLLGMGYADGSLADFRCKFAGIPLRRRVYGNVLAAMGVSGYMEVGDGDEAAAAEGAGHAAAFEFDYDWRRSLDESAIRFQRFVKQLGRHIRSHRRHREPLRFDVVAHSMGGLLLRYYLQYGGQLLPYDGSPPRATWEGAANVENAILVGTPSGGSISALERLVAGLGGNPVIPNYDPAILGTMPSLYQLLPRARHRPFEVDDGCEPPDPLDPDAWVRHGWGLVGPTSSAMLAKLLPGIDRPAERQHVALDHLRKCLASARAFQDALDTVPRGQPSHLRMHLFAGDTLPTPATMRLGRNGEAMRVSRYGAGDRIVLRSSALLDERAGRAWQPRVRSPIHWDGVTFVPGTHLGITHHPVTVDNILYLLLERPID